MSENKNNNKNNKIVRINIGFSWFYLLLIGGIIWMLSKQPSANPQKVEWAEVEAMIEAGDVKEIKFVRNDFKGEITVRPERLAKYSDKFGGNVPARSPHFTFMVSSTRSCVITLHSMVLKIAPSLLTSMIHPFSTRWA
mgnify:CR=1 FL=1